MIWVLTLLLKQQAYANGQAGIQAGQMARRPFFALCYGGIALTLALSVRPVQWALGNRVMHTLAGLSMNYYLAHQCVAVELKRLGFPPSVNELPNQAGEQPWQTQYTWLCFGLSLLLAALLHLWRGEALRTGDSPRISKIRRKKTEETAHEGS